jgi:hypothetical protein
MQSIAKVFQQQPLVVVKLGAGGDDYGFIPEWLRPHTMLLCLDGATSPNKSQATSSQFRRMIMVKDVIAGDQSKRTFIERTWWGCSSLLEAYLPAVERFGLESYFIELGRKPVTTTTLASSLSANGLDRVDVLMTDLEGLDFEIIRSCGYLIDSTTIVQSELRISQSYGVDGNPGRKPTCPEHRSARAIQQAKLSRSSA